MVSSEFTLLIFTIIFNAQFQNRRAKWRKREPPRKTGAYNLNSNNNPPPPITGQTTLHPVATTFTTFQQPTAVTSPGTSVDSWNNYQYETHYSLLSSPASSPYGAYTTHQYATYDQQMFPTRHYEYESPSRTNGILVDGSADSHHKTDYSSIDDGNDA